MEFIQSFFMSIAAFFGLASEPAPELVVDDSLVVAEQTIESSIEEVVDVTDETASEEGVATDVTPELTPETESSAEAMVGSAAPITSVPAAVPATPTTGIATMLVAGGCFWCVESDLEKVPGVISVVSGYAGGTSENPTYDDYGSGGHREVVEVTYNPNQVSFEDILIITMKTTDPTDDDGTFADRGDKYSSAFYYETPEQKTVIDSLIAEVDENGPYEAPLAIDVEPRAEFWSAEDFHQDYYKGTLSQLKYKYYRNASGRDDFIEQYWSDPHSPNLPWRSEAQSSAAAPVTTAGFWTSYVKPEASVLEQQLPDLAFKVTQEDGTERAFTHPYDKFWEEGIYVDILSGEPLYSSKDKYDSGTGWPSFVKPITPEAVTEHEDRSLFSVRTEIRSAIANNHIGHVFSDGPTDRGGLRYCMNGVALKFVPKAEMEARGYRAYLQYL